MKYAISPQSEDKEIFEIEKEIRQSFDHKLSDDTPNKWPCIQTALSAWGISGAPHSSFR